MSGTGASRSGPISETPKARIELPGAQGSVRVYGMMIGTLRAEVVIHANWWRSASVLDADLYVPPSGAGDLAALIEILAHATKAQHRAIAAAIRLAAAGITGPGDG